MDWDEAVSEAKGGLGYREYDYIKDWDEVVDTAKDILAQNREEEYYEFCYKAQEQYKDYLKSDRWEKLRVLALKRDKYKCRDCKKDAKQVHHLSYNNLGNQWEFYEILSLCKECHKKRHGIK